MPSKEMLELVGKALALAAFLFTTFSFVYNQYKERAAARYAASVDMMERYRREGIREAETTLAQRMLYYQADGLDPNNPADFDERFFDAIAKEILFGHDGTDTRSENAFLPRLYLISDFYGEVTFCLDNQICNPDILKSYFCPRASRFGTQNRRLLAYYDDYTSSKELTDVFEKLDARCVG